MSKELEVNAPKVIYLQIGDDHEGEYSDEATWCADKIHNTDIAYVLRSDYDSLHNDWVKISDNQNDEITRLREKVGALTVQLTEAERLNKVALEAMKKVAEQTWGCRGEDSDAEDCYLNNAITELEKP